ncbi:hypothetical protein [Flavihumibacter petaseus]|uniref:Tetratricopeptide repeat protein n=1 Tax=Flavihumibacter petaseus NBRC 106054 TaxID=1220578 RepID=A0A0E9MY09_9BACT|nr:hypothetical protein [Flavihumibacter petaseus]GAO42617.1 hypothetical protein FPE01S_01_16320 [Flavihumibacter petaseus NBRC 106054]
MKLIGTFGILPLLMGIFYWWHFHPNDMVSRHSAAFPEDRQNISCSPSDPDFIWMAGNKFMIPLPGTGNHHYPVSTTNDSTQFYFNQGLTMYYSYHFPEARGSFREAARFDSTAIMAWWGRALVAGPGYNFVYSYRIQPAIKPVLEKMNSLLDQAAPKEKALVWALNQRYQKLPDHDSVAYFPAEYTAAMKKLSADYPDDADIQFLYVDAVMLEHPWNFWRNDGQPQSWTEAVVAVCERAMKMSPEHPAGLHYYIHLTEASRQPEVALTAADKLRLAYPGIAHMVHMSSHEYERNGDYSQGVEVNKLADRNLVMYDSLFPGFFRVKHASHYWAVQSYCAMSGAMHREAMDAAMFTRTLLQLSHDNTYDQYLFMLPSFAQVRAGRWAALISDTSVVQADWSYAKILQAFAKGLAFAHTGELRKARGLLDTCYRYQQDSILYVTDDPTNNLPIYGARVASGILEAEILWAGGKRNAAVAAIRRAVATEDSMTYLEPKEWLLPARQYLGHYLMVQKKFAEAAAVYREDLQMNPGNGWSALGLSQALTARGDRAGSDSAKVISMRSFGKADHQPPGSVYP